MVAKVRAARPKGTAEQIKQRGGDTYALLIEFRSVMEPRMPAGAIDGLGTDLGTIGGVVPNTIAARTEKKAATQTERVTAKEIGLHVLSIRALIQDTYSDKAVLKAWGVGQKMDNKVTKQVLAAGTVIVNRFAAAPQEGRDAGVTDEDIATLTQQLSSLQGADSSQGEKGRSSKEATAVRDATLVRIENTSQTAGLRGRQAFLNNPSVRARFEALLAPYGAKPKKKAPPTGSGGGSTT